MATRWKLLARLLTVAALLAACKGGSTSKKSDDSQPGKDGGEGEQKVVYAVGGPVPTLTLLLPGDEPQREVAYGRGSGTRTVRLAIETSLADAPPETKTTIDLDVMLHPPGKGAEPRRRFRVAKAAIGEGVPPPSPEEREAIAAIAGTLEKVVGQVELKGPHHIAFSQTEGAPTTPSVPWLLHQLAVPLPTYPIGKGAKWSVLQPTISGDGLRGIDKRIYELLELDEEGARVQMAAQIVYDVKAEPRAPSEAALLGVETTTHGELRIAFGDPVPVSGELTITQQTRTSPRPNDAAPGAEAPTETRLRTSMRVRLSSD